MADLLPSGPRTRAALDRVPLVTRAALMTLCIVLAVLGSHVANRLEWMCAVVAAGTVATALQSRPWWSRAACIAEAVVCGIVIAMTGGGISPALPYLLAPAVAAGQVGRYDGVLFVPLAAAAAMTAGRLASPGGEHLRDYTAAGAEWLLLAAAGGLVSAWARRILVSYQSGQQESYAAAYRLLTQLRTVARRLPGSLDPVTIADALLQAAGRAAGYHRGAVFARTGGDRLVPLAHSGEGPLDWDVDLTGDNLFADTWASQQPHSSGWLLTRGGPSKAGSALVIPLRIGLRSFGLVGLESSQRGSFSPETIRRLEGVAEEFALQLETALLFDEVRGVATVEERRRLAREIHDGIAQELASLGYFVDNLAAEAERRDPGLPQSLRALRQELTRIISELRLSIFDLRSDVDRFGGLGAALSEHVRTVGKDSELTVHLSLDETPGRLPAGTEAELLRIAQEAIANARKHAGARNLWVHCMVAPPRAALVVEDDGVGIGDRRRDDSFGLEIMRERAARLRAVLDVSPRTPRGTRVSVTLGATDATMIRADEPATSGKG